MRTKNMTTILLRNLIGRSHLRRGLLLVPLVLACFGLGLSTTTQGVIPAPDGGYAPPPYGANNTAEGQNALLSLTTGTNNTAVGYLSLKSVTTGGYNTGV